MLVVALFNGEEGHTCLPSPTYLGTPKTKGGESPRACTHPGPLIPPPPPREKKHVAWHNMSTGATEGLPRHSLPPPPGVPLGVVPSSHQVPAVSQDMWGCPCANRCRGRGWCCCYADPSLGEATSLGKDGLRGLGVQGTELVPSESEGPRGPRLTPLGGAQPDP